MSLICKAMTQSTLSLSEIRVFGSRSFRFYFYLLLIGSRCWLTIPPFSTFQSAQFWGFLFPTCAMRFILLVSWFRCCWSLFLWWGCSSPSSVSQFDHRYPHWDHLVQIVCLGIETSIAIILTSFHWSISGKSCARSQSCCLNRPNGSVSDGVTVCRFESWSGLHLGMIKQYLY